MGLCRTATQRQGPLYGVHVCLLLALLCASPAVAAERPRPQTRSPPSCTPSGGFNGLLLSSMHPIVCRHSFRTGAHYFQGRCVSTSLALSFLRAPCSPAAGYRSINLKPCIRQLSWKLSWLRPAAWPRANFIAKRRRMGKCTTTCSLSWPTIAVRPDAPLPLHPGTKPDYDPVSIEADLAAWVRFSEAFC